MAARKSHHYLGGAEPLNPPASLDDQFELDEADVNWSANDMIVLPETTKRVHNHTRPARKPLRKSDDVDRLPTGRKSLPMNIPDWSKILGGEYRGSASDGEDDGNDRIPPHEYLARNRGSSFSVHEGAGRTLKGRDLSRVRNAIWKQTGFED